jgi:hypothetical protein
MMTTDGRLVARVLVLTVALLAAFALQPGAGYAQCAHGASIFKSCVSPKRSCATDADCDDLNPCTDDTCDTQTLPNTTDCLITLTHADTCGDVTKITEGFDVQDFGGDNVRVPAVGDLPIDGTSGNFVCCVGPALPCFVGPAGLVFPIPAAETGCGALALPGAGAAGSVSFQQNTYVIQPNDPDPLPDQGNVKVKDLCNAGAAGCSSGISTVQFSAGTDLETGCLNPPTQASTPCPGVTECATAGCDGLGNCDPKHFPVQASQPCTDTDGNVCTIAGCDGLGNCDQAHVTPDSTPCPGAPTECASPGCDGAGNCDPLHVPVQASQPCTDTDGNVCTIAGCDGLGSCDQQHVTPDSTPCPDTGNECAAAGCDGAGNCDQNHVPTQGSTPCADTDGNVCTTAGCDGMGSCDQEHITPDSTPCPDTDGNVCTEAGCDGLGNCDQRHVLPDSTPCPDTGNECGVAGCDGAGNCDQTHIVTDVCLDHFLCYRTKGKQPVTATLADQFDVGTVQAIHKNVLALCTPTNKNGEGIVDPNTHQKMYRVRGPHVRQTRVRVEDQFGTLFVDTVRTDTLLVPTAKTVPPAPPPQALPGVTVDHFRCLRVRVSAGTSFTPQTVTAADQFGTRQLRLTRPLKLCLPTNKNGEGIFDPATHLMCYKAKPTPKHAATLVHTLNQFGAEDNTIRGEFEFCVPAEKSGGVTTTTTTTATTTTSTTTTTTTTSTTTTTIRETLCCEFQGGSPGGAFIACLDAFSPDVEVKCQLLGGILVPGVCDPVSERCVPPQTVPPNDWCCECPAPSPPFPHPQYCFEGMFPADEIKCQPPCILFPGVPCGPASEQCGGP